MFIRITNARTGKMNTINPAMIGMVQDREDERYPNTNAVIIMNDGSATRQATFIPCVETEEEISARISGASGGTAGPNSRMSRSVQDDREIPPNQNER